MDPALIEVGFNLGFPLLLLAFAYFVGTRVEARSYRSIRKREEQLVALPAITLETLPAAWEVERSALLAGNVVVSVDYFKRFLAGLRGLIGGRVKSYESLLDRGRREAVLRLKERAREGGFDAVLNVRLETSRLASSRRDGQGTAGVEVLAFGTGLVLRGGSRSSSSVA